MNMNEYEQITKNMTDEEKDQWLKEQLQIAFPNQDHNPSEATIKKWQQEDARADWEFEMIVDNHPCDR